MQKILNSIRVNQEQAHYYSDHTLSEPYVMLDLKIRKFKTVLTDLLLDSLMPKCMCQCCLQAPDILSTRCHEPIFSLQIRICISNWKLIRMFSLFPSTPLFTTFRTLTTAGWFLLYPALFNLYPTFLLWNTKQNRGGLDHEQQIQERASTPQSQIFQLPVISFLPSTTLPY